MILAVLDLAIVLVIVMELKSKNPLKLLESDGVILYLA